MQSEAEEEKRKKGRTRKIAGGGGGVKRRMLPLKSFSSSFVSRSAHFTFSNGGEKSSPINNTPINLKKVFVGSILH